VTNKRERPLMSSQLFSALLAQIGSGRRIVWGCSYFLPSWEKDLCFTTPRGIFCANPHA